MKLLVCTILVLLLVATHAVIVEKLPFVGARLLDEELLESLREKIEEAGGCNANVCFAIDGSGSIPSDEFRGEKDFVLDVSSVIASGDPNPVEMAAVQFSSGVKVISPLTTNDGVFNEKVELAKQKKRASFVVGGINKCFSLLFSKLDEVAKIVVLTDGRSNIGSSAVRRADLFRDLGGTVCVVGAGFQDDEELLAIAGGDPSLVYEVGNFLDVLAFEQLIGELVESICTNLDG